MRKVFPVCMARIPLIVRTGETYHVRRNRVKQPDVRMDQAFKVQITFLCLVESSGAVQGSQRSPSTANFKEIYHGKRERERSPSSLRVEELWDSDMTRCYLCRVRPAEPARQGLLGSGLGVCKECAIKNGVCTYKVADCRRRVIWTPKWQDLCLLHQRELDLPPDTVLLAPDGTTSLPPRLDRQTGLMVERRPPAQVHIRRPSRSAWYLSSLVSKLRTPAAAAEPCQNLEHDKGNRFDTSKSKDGRLRRFWRDHHHLHHHTRSTNDARRDPPERLGLSGAVVAGNPASSSAVSIPRDALPRQSSRHLDGRASRSASKHDAIRQSFYSY